MIKASYLQKQGLKYRELAREEASLEMRRQLFALAARCDELATTISRWPLPKTLTPRTTPPCSTPEVKPNKPPVLEGTASPAPLPFPSRARGRVVHRLDS